MRCQNGEKRTRRRFRVTRGGKKEEGGREGEFSIETLSGVPGEATVLECPRLLLLLLFYAYMKMKKPDTCTTPRDIITLESFLLCYVLNVTSVLKVNKVLFPCHGALHSGCCRVAPRLPPSTACVLGCH